jgi:succinoglycan biosynthesis protein ExoM
LRALAQALSMIVAFPAEAWCGREALLDYSYRYAGVLGKLSFGEVYPIYRRTAIPSTNGLTGQ